MKLQFSPLSCFALLYATILVIAVFFPSRSFALSVEKDPPIIYYKFENKIWNAYRKDIDGYGIYKKDVNTLNIPGLSATTMVSASSQTISENNFSYFPSYTTLPLGNWVEALCIVDINGDQRNDVLVLETNNGVLSILTQNIVGELVLDTTLDPSGYRSESVDAGDLNGDGLIDIVIGNTATSIEVFLQQPDGSFLSNAIFPTSNSACITIGDLNNDGKNDIVGIGHSTQQASVYLQQNDGILVHIADYSIPYGGFNDLEVADLNNDDLLDIIVMSGQLYVYDNIAVLLQLSEGGFAPAVTYDLGGNELGGGLGTGDVNGDGMTDIVMSYGGNRPNSHIAVFPQNGVHLLDTPAIYTSYDIPEPVDICDINSDGLSDVIVLHGGWNRVGIYFQNKDGTLGSENLYTIPYASHYNPQGLDVGDINGDGVPDIAIADYNHGLVILYNTFVPPKLSVSINGRSRFQNIDKGTSVSITASFDPGSLAMMGGELYLCLITPSKEYWRLPSESWKLSNTPICYKGPALESFTDKIIFNSSNLNYGLYQVFMSSDNAPDNTLNGDVIEGINFIIK